MAILKDNVNWTSMHPAIQVARTKATALYAEYLQTTEDLVITSGRRGQTTGGSSLHPHGKAMDLRVWAFKTHEDQREFGRILRFAL